MKSSFFKRFEIEIFQLQNKKYEYSFEVEKAFFEQYEGSLTSNGYARADVSLTKNNEMFQFEMNLNGWVELVCDRSLETFQHPIKSIEKFIYKYDEHEGELGDGLFGIRNSTLTINMKDRIYEGIAIQIPFKKIHPKFSESEAPEVFEDEEANLIYTSKESEKETDSQEEIDPRWKELLKLKNNSNN